ncbi:hypothetical protein [Treponema sp.]|uniref:hypothetical protein n=1 Tax=Treponema sp. TaxID=166 RepID=UPI00298DFF67|nr:hypothetical protein [Treponema sp.]MCR5612686.1 hypothetical protein [Treponema sp.]
MRARAVSVDSSYENSISVDATVYSISSSFDDTSPVSGDVGLDLLQASGQISITQGGFGTSCNLNAISVSGKIGTKYFKIPFVSNLLNRKFQLKIGAGLGVNLGYELKADVNSGLVFDVSALLKARVEINLEKINE